MGKNSRIGYLEGLRGITSLMVVVHHLVYGFYPALLTGNHQQVHTGSGWEVAFGQTPLNIIYNGHYYVSVLFVLSAYVLSYRFFQTGNEKGVIASAVKRYFRLGLPIMASVFFAGFMMMGKLYYNQAAAGFSGSDWLASFWNFAPSLGGMLYQGLWGVFAYNQYSYNAVLWTMQYELYGSFLVFFFCLTAGKLRNRWLLYGLMLCIFRESLYFAFVLGLMISDWDAGRKAPSGSKNGLGLALMAAGLLIGSFLDNGSPLYRWMSGYGKYSFDFMVLYQNIGAGLLVWAILLSGRLQQLFSRRGFQYLGWMSFALYLTHLPIEGTLTSYVFQKAFTMGYSYKTAVALAVVPSMAVMIGVAHLMTRYVDQPSLRLAEKIRVRFFAVEGVAVQLAGDAGTDKNTTHGTVLENGAEETASSPMVSAYESNRP